MRDRHPDMDAPLALVEYDEGTNPRAIYAGSSSGLFVDRGDGWIQVEDVVEPGMPVTALAIVGAGTGEPVILAGVNGGIIRYSPRSSRQVAIPLGSPPPLITCMAGWSGDGSEGRLLAGTLEDGVFWSDDGGFTWGQANTGLLDMAVYALACSSATNERGVALAATETNVFESTNGGRRWSSLGFPDTGETPVQAIARMPSGNRIVAGTGGAGLFATTSLDGEWVAVGQDLPDQVVMSLYAVDQAAAFIAVFETGIAVSTAVDSGWSFSGAGLAPDDRIVCSNRLTDGSLAVGLASGQVRVIPDPVLTVVS